MPETPLSPVLPPVIPVSALNRAVRMAIEQGVASCWVSGEISNLTRAPSGHWYFTLKDATASVRCAMFRGRNQFVDFAPANGQQIEVRAQATLYEARGEFQLAVEAMRRAGMGNLFEAFLKLKAKLENEGLFAADRKRTLPACPRTIGIISSPRAAALRDVITTLQRRWPAARVILYPSPVQGADAPAKLLATLQTAIRRAECEVLLLVRGGGSIEDLWAFNDEALARAIAASPIPVVSGVGHETDFTLADFVADLRAPTPTAAAELATPNGLALSEQLNADTRRLQRAQKGRLEQLAQRLDLASRRLQHPASRLEAQNQHLQHLVQRLTSATRNRFAQTQQQLRHAGLRLNSQHPNPGPSGALAIQIGNLQQRLRYSIGHQLTQRQTACTGLTAQLRQLNPEAVLGRGYSIVRDAQNRIVINAKQLHPGDRLTLTLAHGAATSRVEEVTPTNNLL